MTPPETPPADKWKGFVDLLLEAKEPEIRCHPKLFKYGCEIAESVNRHVIVESDPYMAEDQIAVMDRAVMRRQWEEMTSWKNREPIPFLPTPDAT